MSIMKNVIDSSNIDYNTKELFSNGNKKMQMTVERKAYYRNQIKFYLLKIWKPITNDLKVVSIQIDEKEKILERNKTQILFDDLGSVASVISSGIQNNSIINDNNNYTKTVIDEKSSFMQSESISDETITAFERIIYFLVIPFIGLLIADYILFSIEKNDKTNFIKFSNNMMQTLLILEKLNLLSRSYLNSLNNMEPLQFKTNDLNLTSGFNKQNFTIEGINFYSSTLSEKLADIIQNPLYYNSTLNSLSIRIDVIVKNSLLITQDFNLISFIETFNQFVNGIINLPFNYQDRIISSFGAINSSINYTLPEINNFKYLWNTQRYLFPVYSGMIESLSSFLVSKNKDVTSIILVILFSLVYTLILIFILYYSIKIKKRKTIYINYFIEIKDPELNLLKDNCTKFFKFLNGKIVFDEFLKITIQSQESTNKIEEINPKLNESDEMKRINLSNNVQNTALNNENSNIVLNSISSNKPKKGILKTVLNEIPDLSTNKSENKLKDIISLDENKKRKITKKKRSTNEVISVEIIENKPEQNKKSDKEVRKEIKKQGILDSSKKDSNNILYFILGGFIGFGLFLLLYLSLRTNLKNSYILIQIINKANYNREINMLKLFNLGKDLISFKLPATDIYYKNFIELDQILSNLNTTDYLLSNNSKNFNYLNKMLINDQNSIIKNNFCSVITDNFTTQGYSFYLKSDIKLSECNNINNRLLSEGVLYFIHDINSQYQNMINLYYLNYDNKTYLMNLLNDEDINMMPFLYLKYIAIFFEYFNDIIITSYNDYLVSLATIMIIDIIIFLMIILIKITIIIKLFYLDIKNARGMICIIPSKYLKENTSTTNK